MKTLHLIKIGGQLIEEEKALSELLKHFAALDGPKLIVHGGGRRATQLCQQLNIPSQMIEGRRVTDAATLEVVAMVYAGLVNKTIVSQLQAQQCNALGLSGADLNLLRAHKREAGTLDYGFAGDIDEVNAVALCQLLQSGILPVCCAITHDGQGQLLNTNADSIATALAKALAPFYQVRLFYCFEHRGVLKDVKDPDSHIAQLSKERYQQYRQGGQIAGGMIPKLDNAFDALENQVAEVYIGHPQSLLTSD
ncbi:MAG: acetylglutamate kinase, partial [Bacteroidota bacterium]